MGKRNHGPATLPLYRIGIRSKLRVTPILIDTAEEEGFNLAGDSYIESLCELDRRLKGEET